MSRLLFETLPPPTLTYDQRQMASLVRILQQSLQRVDYTPKSDDVATKAQSWLGL